MSPPAPRKRPVIIGVGNPMRRDDGVGPAVIAELHARSVDADLVTLDGEPTRLLDAWSGRDRAIVVDAVTSDSAVGTIHRIDVATDPIPAPPPAASSHGAGLAEAVELARALDALPGRLVVFGIEADNVSFGEGLSPAVEAAVDDLLRHIDQELAVR